MSSDEEMLTGQRRDPLRVPRVRSCLGLVGNESGIRSGGVEAADEYCQPEEYSG